MKHSSLPMRSATGLALVALAFLAGACASRTEPVAAHTPGLMDRLTPYKVEVQQGNVVTRDQVALVKPGMQREQVRDILGSPMLTDVFHARRWDYLYAVGRSSGAPQQRWVVTVHFDGDAVQRVAAPELPTENEFVARMAGNRAQPKDLPALELTPDQRAKLPVPVRTETEAPAQPQGAQRTYPPLESR